MEFKLEGVCGTLTPVHSVFFLTSLLESKKERVNGTQGEAERKVKGKAFQKCIGFVTVFP
jgi:hypothetical protein